MMKNIRLAIIPGLVGGILCLIGVATMAFNVRNLTLVTKENGGKPQSCNNNKKIPREVRRWCDLITIYANTGGVDPLLIAAMIEQESGGKQNAISKDGAVGLMQIMPGDGKALEFLCQGGTCFSGRPSSKSLLKPEYNIPYGVGLLSDLIRKTGDLREALRFYGPCDIGYDYADKVLNVLEGYQ